MAQVTSEPTSSIHADAHDHLCMPEEARKRAHRRIAIARGHLESIQKMLEDPHAYCVDVLMQLKAVQGALSGAGDVVLRGHLEAHVATAATRGDTTEIVDELMEALKYR
ncbi:MAG: metal-sensitive transcriptional regulator [Pleurocapsa sp. SU_196_0]|nr:metal-sensitive transcriptional regulator [Pleurocapsa sp. SU_196_0]